MPVLPVTVIALTASLGCAVLGNVPAFAAALIVAGGNEVGRMIALRPEQDA